MSGDSYDVLVIGSGIAGASVAAQLAPHRRVAIVEREPQPGYHATGRSAAVFSETYGPAPIRALTRASRAFLFGPPSGFCETPLVSPRGALHVAREDQIDAMTALIDDIGRDSAIRCIDGREAGRLSPLLRPEQVAAAVHDPQTCDIDVHALHQGYLRQVRRNGGAVLNNADVLALLRHAGEWVVTTTAAQLRAPIVVNAAGAWADTVAKLADVRPLGLQPLRRTALTVEIDAPNLQEWPLTIAIDESYYFKPDAGCLLLSPGDEHPSPPCDAAPEEWDVAVAIDRVETATTLQVRRVHARWAGLRSFLPDRVPAVGFDPDADGFFWLAGQGGYGIQTAPMMGALAASLICDQHLPEIPDATQRELAPSRLRSTVPA